VQVAVDACLPSGRRSPCRTLDARAQRIACGQHRRGQRMRACGGGMALEQRHRRLQFGSHRIDPVALVRRGDGLGVEVGVACAPAERDDG
jgi:hypothetical protein